jgi:tetratricopeptide (TPR) repeat protein
LWWWLFLAVVGCGVVGTLIHRNLSKPSPVVPVPANLAALDPMLRNYVTGKVDWARESPRSPDRQGNLGLVYAANGLWAEAQLAFANTVQLNPKEPLGWLYWAISSQELGQPDRAMDLLRTLTRRFPDFAPGFSRLGDYSLRLGSIDEAERAFQRLTQLAPREWRGSAGLGEVQLRKGNLTEAVRWLEQAVELDRTAKPAHALLGQAYQQLNRAREARRELALGMNASHFPMPDPWSVQAPQHMRLLVDLIEMAQEHLRGGAPDKAAAVLEDARIFHPDNPTLLINLAQAYTAMGNPQKAVPLLDRVLQLDHSAVPAYVAMVGCELAMGRADQALSNANHAIVLATNRADAYLAQANALLALERDTDAVAALELAHQRDPKNPQILLDLGDICLLNLHRPQEALTYYRAAVALDCSLAGAHLRIARACFELKDKPGAAESIEEARLFEPNNPDVAAALARLRKTP